MTSISSQNRASLPGSKRVRNQKATRALIVLYFAGLIVAALLFVISLITGSDSWTFSLSYTAAMLLSMAAWTYIRGANDSKDRLPDAKLDEYERDIFATWRQRAFKAFSALTLVGGAGFLLYATFIADAANSVAYKTAGLYMLFTYLFVATLPMIGFAAIINRDHPEDQPVEE
nr:Uncharacterised protein [Streptococcus thermophilus]